MPRFLLLLLAGLTASVPLAIDAYLPAFPEMAKYFSVSIYYIELSLSLFLACFALGQLVGGPLSDRFGRRTGVFSGLTLFCLGTVAIIFSPTVEWLWAGRMLEAFGGGLAVVNSTAVIRDMSEGTAIARNIANMMVIMLVAPLLAPMIGSLLLYLGEWHLIFEFLLCYGLLIGVLLFFNLSETRKKTSEQPHFIKRYWQVLSHAQALGYIFSRSFAMASLFAFVSSSAFVYLEYFGLSSNIFPFFFGVGVIGIIAGNRINVVLLRYIQPIRVLTIGQVTQVVLGCCLLIYVSIIKDLSPYVIAAIVTVYMSMNGFIISNASALTVDYFPHNAATATALGGAMGFALSALSSASVGIFSDGTLSPMAMVMLTCSVLAIVLRFFMQRKTLDDAPLVNSK